MINTEFIRNNILTSGLELVSEKAILELLDHLEATERGRDWHAERCEDAMNKCAALRAKIEAMERQEPVAWTTKLALEYGASALGFRISSVNIWGEKGVPLYTLPGAQGPEVK